MSSALVDISVVQRDINTLIAVAKSWDLRVNASMTKVIRFSAHLRNTLDLGPYSTYQIKGNPLYISPKVVHLGITIDTTLRFYDHIHSVVSKAAGSANNLLKSTLCVLLISWSPFSSLTPTYFCSLDLPSGIQVISLT